MKYLFFLVPIFILFSSCKKDKSILDKFDESVRVSTDTTIQIEKEYFKFAKIINLSDSILAITVRNVSYTSEDKLIHFISKKTWKIVKSLAPSGSGPNEFMGIHSASMFDNNIIFYDPINVKTLQYNIANDSIKIKSIKAENKFYSDNMYFFDENRSVSSGIFGNYMYQYIDNINAVDTMFLEYPFLPNIPESKQNDYFSARFEAYTGSIILQPNKFRFAYYCVAAEHIQIIELDGLNSKYISASSFAPPSGKLDFNSDAYVWRFDQNSKYSFIDATASDTFLYLLYSGNNIMGPDASRGSYVCIFDWEGKAIKILNIDKNVYSIAIDKKDKELFAFSTNETTLKNEIIRYSL